MTILYRYIFCIVYLFISCHYTSGTNIEQIIIQADSAYNARDYTQASLLYHSVIDSTSTPSAEIYYNYGNALYRTGNIPQAIIAYTRALQIDPTLSEARENLAFINQKLTDRKGDEGTVLSRLGRTIAKILSPMQWAWTAMSVFMLACIGFVIYKSTSQVLLRKSGFFGSIALGFCWILAIVSAIYAYVLSKSNDGAVVTTGTAILSTAPHAPVNQSEEAFTLHGGAKITIIDSVALPTDSISPIWYKVVFDNDHSAWIGSHDIEKI